MLLFVAGCGGLNGWEDEVGRLACVENAYLDGLLTYSQCPVPKTYADGRTAAEIEILASTTPLLWKHDKSGGHRC